MKNNSPWWKLGVFYQIYPRSFMDSNGDGVGDLQGILDRLDYIVKLGVDAIWISPIFPSPMADFGYDVSDYTGIDPIFGDMDTFDRLLAEAHRRGLRIVLDYVPNHSSIEHPWFRESRSSRENPKRDWYIWKDPSPHGGPPNNWEAVTGGSAWNWDENTGQYYLSQFIKDEPDLNWRNPEVVESMENVLHFWLRKGVDGFRMDMLPHLVEHPDFPDNPPIPDDHPYKLFGQRLEQVYTVDQPETHAIVRQFRKICDSYDGERVIIGETPLFDMQKLASYYGKNLDEVHIPFNFKLLLTGWDSGEMKAFLEEYYAVIPEGAAPSIVFGNHDFARIATKFRKENLRSASVLLLTLWGVPTMYYGDEIGMENAEIPPDRLQDPWADPEKGTGRDPERTPMQWNSSPNAGFSPPGVKTWLPIADNFRSVNVADQERDPDSNLNFYRRLLELRGEYQALHEGGFEFFNSVPKGMLAYKRKSGEKRVLVLVNFESKAHQLDLSALGSDARILLSTVSGKQDQVDLSRLGLGPNQSLILLLE